jgi:hypothetical protein
MDFNGWRRQECLKIYILKLYLRHAREKSISALFLSMFSLVEEYILETNQDSVEKYVIIHRLNRFIFIIIIIIIIITW